MKDKLLIIIFVLTWLSWANLLQAEGFVAGTLIATQHGLIPIERIVVGDTTQDENFVFHATNILAHCYAKITVEDFCISAALDQKFYEINRGWVAADSLLPLNELLCCDGTIVTVKSVDIIPEQIQLYAFSVEPRHIFYITQHAIIAHNFEIVSSSAAATAAISFVCPPVAAGFAIVEAITAGAMCLGVYSVYKKHQKHKKKKKKIREEAKVISAHGGGKDPKDDDEKNNEKRYPYGIYEDAPYHTPNGTTRKSPRPQDGQAALDNSVPISHKSTGRVGVSKDEIVVLRKTLDRMRNGKRETVYHGHVGSWKKINQTAKNALIKNGLVNNSGEILKL